MKIKATNILGNTARGVAGVAGLGLLLGSCTAACDNKIRNEDGDGIVPTRSAVAYVLKVDTAKKCNMSERKLSNLEYFLSDATQEYVEYWDCNRDEVASTDDKAPDADRQWHKAKTLREKIALLFGNISSGLLGLLFIAASAAIPTKSKDDEDEKKNENK